jgi:nitric oxide reductase subunit B
MVVGFWGLNAGLMGMIAITLFPVGAMQAVESFQNGFWSARSWDFYQQPVVNTLLWLRVIPDTVFIFAGVIPIVAAALWGFVNMRAEAPLPESAPPQLSPESKPAVSPVYRNRIQ